MTTSKLTDTFVGLVTGHGLTFLLAYYLPVLFLVSVNQYLLLPLLVPDWIDWTAVPNFGIWSGELMITLVLPFLGSMLLLSTNTLITRFFEGVLVWQRGFWWGKRREKFEEERKQRYGRLLKLRSTYLALLETSINPIPSTQMAEDSVWDALQETAVDLQTIHEEIEASPKRLLLPKRKHYVNATALGNAFSMFEEYPLEHYGMDSVLFWPHLRQVVDDKLLATIDQLKMIFDFQLNLMLVALLIGLEMIIVGIMQKTAVWWISAFAMLLFGLLGYHMAVRIARQFGVYINTCFDLYRHELLKKFGLNRPENFYEEYKIWLRLGAFLRRGELFYWPGE